jgi:hypothetical protein
MGRGKHPSSTSTRFVGQVFDEQLAALINFSGTFALTFLRASISIHQGIGTGGGSHNRVTHRSSHILALHRAIERKLTRRN